VPHTLADGVNYAVDLSKKNAEKLRLVLERYVAAGTRTQRGGRYLGAGA
jgi:Lsr2